MSDDSSHDEGTTDDAVMSPASFGRPLDTLLAIPFAALGGSGSGGGSGYFHNNNNNNNDDVVQLSLRTMTILLVISFLYRLRTKIRFLPLSPALPGPPIHPLLGIVPYIVPRWKDWPAETLRLSRQFEWRTWGGPAPNFGGSPGGWIMISDPQNLKYILADNFENYTKTLENGNGLNQLYRELLGDGIFAADGERWVKHRKIASKMFSRNLLRHTAVVTLGKLREIGGVFRKALAAAAAREQQDGDGDDDDGGGGGGGVNFDVQDLFFRMTFDTTSLVAFGCEFDSVRDGGATRQQHPFAVAFDEMQRLIVDRTLDPFFPLKRSLRFGTRERRIRELKVVLDGHAADFIRTKRRSAADGCELGPDILSRFLAHSEKTGVPTSNVELRDVVMNILIAGRDTTACALSWTFWELSRNPDVVAKILAEVEEVCGAVVVLDDDDDDEQEQEQAEGGQEHQAEGRHDDRDRDANNDYSYDAASKLQYTHATILEVLRLHPSVSNDHKYAVRDDTLPDGTFVPAGTGVAYLPYAMGRSDKIWGEGADGTEFRPERFLEEVKEGGDNDNDNANEGDGKGGQKQTTKATVLKAKEPSPFKYPVFNAGPRLCLGKPLALTTVKLTLAYLLPRFVFEDKKGHDGSYRWTMVRSMKDGFEMNVSRRRG